MPSKSKKPVHMMATAAHKAGAPMKPARKASLADMQANMRKMPTMGRLEKMQKMR